MSHRLAALAALSLFACAKAPAPAPEPLVERYAVLIEGTRVGHLVATTTGDAIAIDYDFKNNGRGPTMTETITLGEDGLPAAWRIAGTTTFGARVDERFDSADGNATWTDNSGTGAAAMDEPTLYIAQNASPYAQGLYARALIADADDQLPALPAGALKAAALDTFEAAGASVTAYAVSGADLDPKYVALDGENRFFAYMTPNFVIVREGAEAAEPDLQERSARYNADRFAAIQTRHAKNFAGAVRIRNVRVFDHAALALSAPQSVIVENGAIARLEAADAAPTPGETLIDGEGGALLPGLYDMHGHLSDNAALMNVLAGVTSVRDMGNQNDVLTALIGKFESGALAGPRVTRSGFIEGKSPFSANNGELVESEEQALAAVRKYAAAGDYHQIKLYNSMNGAWAPALAKEAHALGLKVAGHVPAFSNADAMIEAGYDELTHINQLMLGWVLEPEEDTRTLLRLTALKRLADLDLASPRVQKTIDAMVARKVAIDPTVAIHEWLLLSRDGQMRPGVADYVANMPPNFQRNSKVARIAIADAAEDAAYRAAYDKIIEAVALLHARSIFIVGGTDLGGAFELHRELELYQQIGMSPAEIIKRASHDMAVYLGEDATLGSIAAGKRADFFLVAGDPTTDFKAIKKARLVAKDGVFYLPADIYPEFGITPLATSPAITPAE